MNIVVLLNRNRFELLGGITNNPNLGEIIIYWVNFSSNNTTKENINLVETCGLYFEYIWYHIFLINNFDNKFDVLAIRTLKTNLACH